MDANSQGGHGGSAGSSTNIASVGGTNIAAGQDTDGTHSIPVVLPSGLAVLINGTMTGTLQSIPGTSGGLSYTSTIWANNTTAVVIKNAPGQVYGVELLNNSSTIAYLKVYDATSATAGSGTPKMRFMIPAPASGGGGAVSNNGPGIAFGTGITIIVTTGIADNDTGTPAATAYIVNILYK